MCDDERPLLWKHLVLLGSEPLQQLSPHHQKHGAEEGAAEVQSGVVLLQALAEHGDVAEADPPGGRRGEEEEEGGEERRRREVGGGRGGRGGRREGRKRRREGRKRRREGRKRREEGGEEEEEGGEEEEERGGRREITCQLQWSISETTHCITCDSLDVIWRTVQVDFLRL